MTDSKPDSKEPEQTNDRHGYEFFPNREEGKLLDDKVLDKKVASMVDIKEFNTRRNCIQYVNNCAESDPIVKLMMGALRRRGCPIKLERHVSCEPCKLKVSGGYDPTVNQVVLCENNLHSQGLVCHTMAHELLHAYDNCRAKFNFKDPRHIACTEVRASNIMHCSMMSSFSQGISTPWRLKNTQKECVKQQATRSLVLVRDMDWADARSVVDDVFNRCYNDLEPVGRRIKHNVKDEERALYEGLLYGYSEDEPKTETKS